MTSVSGKIDSGVAVRGDSGVAGEGRVIFYGNQEKYEDLQNEYEGGVKYTKQKLYVLTRPRYLESSGGSQSLL